MVAIRQAGTHHLALVAVALGRGQQTERRLDVAYVENAHHEVCSHEMTVEGIAEPVAKFGLKHPVLPLLVVGKRKGIVIAGEIGRPLRGKLHLYPEVQGGGEIVQKVAFYSYILCQKWHTKRK